MSLKKIFFASSLALTSSLALAGNEPSYDYLQAGFVDYDGADGFSLELSKSFSDSFYGRIDYTDLDADGFNAGVDFTRINLGYKTAISQNADFVAEIGYEDVEANILNVSGDDSGYNALVGIRGMLSNNFELGGFVQYSDVLESTDITLEARYHLTNQFSIAAEVGNDDELDEHYGINLRYSF